MRPYGLTWAKFGPMVSYKGICSLKKRYLDKHLWAMGYFYDSYTVNEEIIRNYITKQFNEHKNDVFCIEE